MKTYDDSFLNEVPVELVSRWENRNLPGKSLAALALEHSKYEKLCKRWSIVSSISVILAMIALLLLFILIRIHWKGEELNFIKPLLATLCVLNLGIAIISTVKLVKLIRKYGLTKLAHQSALDRLKAALKRLVGSPTGSLTYDRLQTEAIKERINTFAHCAVRAAIKSRKKREDLSLPDIFVAREIERADVCRREFEVMLQTAQDEFGLFTELGRSYFLKRAQDTFSALGKSSS